MTIEAGRKTHELSKAQEMSTEFGLCDPNKFGPFILTTRRRYPHLHLKGKMAAYVAVLDGIDGDPRKEEVFQEKYGRPFSRTALREVLLTY